MVAFGALARSESHVGLAPGGEERWECAHVAGRCAAAAEGYSKLRITLFVEKTAGAHDAHPLGDGVQRFVPGNGRPPRVLVASLSWIGSLHGARDAVGVVGFLD